MIEAPPLDDDDELEPAPEVDELEDDELDEDELDEDELDDEEELDEDEELGVLAGGELRAPPPLPQATSDEAIRVNTRA